DLYYRLAVLHIKLPALRERTGDMFALVSAILSQLNVRDPSVISSLLSEDFLETLSQYRWPGNVRQLRNYIERRVALGELVPPPGTDSLSPPQYRSETTLTRLAEAAVRS